mgnify:CR=1 FL=1
MLNLIKAMLEKIRKTRAKSNCLHYISMGQNILPDKLSVTEEQKLAKELADGNLSAKQELIEHNLRLVVFTAQKFDNTGVSMEDLISIGTIGLIKAVNSFDFTKQIKLATYASRCIENEILMHLRKTVRQKAEISFDEPLNVDWEGNVLLLSDVLGTDSDVIYKDVESGAEREILAESFARLGEREKKILKMRFGLFGEEEKTQKEIAAEMGISQSYISRLEKKIVGKLKKEIGKLV